MNADLWMTALSVLRTAAALVFTLILPGMAVCYFLFPLESLKGVPRLFLVLGLSVMLACLTCVFLLFTFGNLQPGYFAVTNSGLMLAFFAAGAIRWRRSPGMALKAFLRQLSGAAALRQAAGSLLAILLFSAAAVTADRLQPGGVTELYFVDPQFSAQVAPGEHLLRLPCGIRNLEGHAQTYRMAIRVDGQVLASRESIFVEDGQRWQEIVQLDVSAYQGVHLLEVLLYEGSQPEAAMKLQAWLTR